MMPWASRLSFLATVVTVLSTTVSSLHLYDPKHAARHASVHQRLERANISERGDTSLGRREFDNARLTCFAPGVNACGSVDAPSAFIVAMNVEQWNGGQYCYQMVTIEYGGATIEAQVTDECPGCPYGGLDLGTDLCTAIGNPEGIVYGTWYFNTDASQPPASPTPTPTDTPTPTPMYTPPPPPPTTSETPSTTWTPPPSTTSAPTSSAAPISSAAPNSSRSSSSFATSSTGASIAAATSSSPQASATVSSTPQGLLVQFNVALLGLVDLMIDANE